MMGMGPCGDEDGSGAYELHLLYADPGALRQGSGTEMLRFFEARSRERGCKRFAIRVPEENSIGRSFYEKHGYRQDGKNDLPAVEQTGDQVYNGGLKG